MNGPCKTALVTGGTHGIGKATAQMLAAHGFIVYICGSNPADPIGPLMENETAGLFYRPVDVTEESMVEALINEIIKTWGRLDLAFNNAGTGCTPKPPHETDMSDFEKVIRVNLTGTAICMKHETRVMLHQKPQGIIINNASVSAYKSRTGADASYAASKAGITALTREAAVVKSYKDKVLFYTIVPGYIETRMTALDDKAAWSERLPAGKPGKPEDVANVVLHIAEAPIFISGHTFFIDGGDFLI